jgi:M6 family metalloprotease-like protein
MTPRSLAPALLLTLLAAPALQAQDQAEAQSVDALRPGPQAPPPLRHQLQRGLDRLAHSVPGLEGLGTPTTGVLNLAVVLVEFPDTPRPAGFSDPANWEASLFQRGYSRTATGEVAYGSVADYYAECSGGALVLQGRVFDWVNVGIDRAGLEEQPWLAPLTNQQLYGGALSALADREGADVLEGFDALVFVTAGGWASTRGSALWPHSAFLFYDGQPWSYYSMHAGTQWFEPIGVHAHELGHVLGVLDKYGVGNRTGLGQWCSMSTGAHGARWSGVPLETPPSTPGQTVRRVVREQLVEGLGWVERALEQVGSPQLDEQLQRIRERLAPPALPRPDGEQRAQPRLLRPPTQPGQRPQTGEERPLHYCAVCKHLLRWSDPLVVDPRSGPQRLYLTPIEDDPNQCVRVLLDPQGRESLYLELRSQRGFDTDLVRGGLVVWRVGSPGAALRTLVPFEQVELIGAHGQESTDAALRAPDSIPFPWGDVDHVTVRGHGHGAWAVELREIRLDGDRLYVEIAAAE